MTRYFIVLLIGAAACDPSGPIEPGERLPPAEPGIRLPFPAPEDDGLYPQIAWDSDSQGLVLPDQPSRGPATLMRFDVQTGSVTPLDTLSDGLEFIGAGGGSTFYTQSMAKANVLSRVGGVAVATVSAVQFAVSRNGRWVVVRDSGWIMIDLATGARRSVPAVPEFRIPLAVDSAGTQVAFGLIGQLSEFDLSVTLADMATGMTRTIDPPGERLLAIEFIGDRLMLLASVSRDSAGQSDVSFISRTDLPNSARVIGTVHTTNRQGYVGVCADWSPEAGYGVGVVRTGAPTLGRARHAIVKLDSAAQVIGTADLMAPTDCMLSPDGKWFVYGNAAGYMRTGELYLKPVR